jgi:hypothetical protein
MQSSMGNLPGGGRRFADLARSSFLTLLARGSIPSAAAWILRKQVDAEVAAVAVAYRVVRRVFRGV